LLDQKRRLQFEARFRDEPTFRKVFGETASPSDPVPGHYEPAQPGSWASRLIVNASGDTWLYFQCGGAECLFGRGRRAQPGATPEAIDIRQEVTAETSRLVLEPAGAGWKLNLLTPRGVHPRVKDLVVRRSEPRFTGIPAASGDVHSLGVFSEVKPMRQHQRLLHLWLWRNGGSFWGYYVRTIQPRASHARFIHPQRIEGRLEGTAEDLRFTARAGRDELHGQLTGGKLRLQVLYSGRPLEEAILEPQAVIEDEVFDLAPSWSRKDQDTWFRAVFTGTFVEWQVP
jgi:hypothetical protein